MFWVAYVCLFFILVTVYILRHKIFGTTKGLYYASYRVSGSPVKSMEVVNVNLNDVALTAQLRTPTARVVAALAKFN